MSSAYATPCVCNAGLLSNQHENGQVVVHWIANWFSSIIYSQAEGRHMAAPVFLLDSSCLSARREGVVIVRCMRAPP